MTRNKNGEMTINLDKHHLNVMNVKDHLKLSLEKSLNKMI